MLSKSVFGLVSALGADDFWGFSIVNRDVISQVEPKGNMMSAIENVFFPPQCLNQDFP